MQQLFRLLIFLIQPYIFRATNSPILRSTFWLYIYIQLLVKCTDTAADRCHGWDGTPFHLNRDRQQCRYIAPKAVYTIKKCSWGWANLSPETCRAELIRSINEKVVESCWLFTSSQGVKTLYQMLLSVIFGQLSDGLNISKKAFR